MLLFALWLAFPCHAQTEVPADWFPFVVSELAEDSVANVARLNEGVAGADGFVQIRDGQFRDGAGRRLRFLGTNLCFQYAFPPKELAPAIARRMASLGINIVRFHHMDAHHAPRGIWDPAHETRLHIDAEQIDRLDWLIHHLKQHGIYSNINLHVSRKFTEAEGFENADLLPRYDKGVNHFQARMVELQRDYARDLLTHRNPYTGTRYVDEPAVAMVELTNESSLLQFSFGATLHELPEPYRGELQGYWTDWLRGAYPDDAALRAAWDEDSEPLGEEMLRNRDFAQGTAEWRLESRHPEGDVFEIVTDPEVGPALHARLNTLGVNPWDFQVHQVGHTLQDERVYTVAFKIRADPPRSVHVSTRYDIPDWRNVGLDERVQADGQWREHEFTFRARGPLEGHTRLSFNCQNELGSVWLADVSLRPGGIRGLPEDQSLAEGNVDFPTPSATLQARRDWFAFIMELERRYTQGMHDYLKQELGLNAHVISTQASYGGIGGVWREAQLDYIDMHSYWQHPRFPGRPWDPGNWNIPNTPMTAALGADTLTRLAQHRVAGMAFTVSEYNHPAPNDYRAECMTMFSALASVQDWDGIFQFTYGGHPEDWETARITSYFNMATDPASLAFFPVAANLFRRGDVRPALEEVRLRVPQGKLVDLVTAHQNNAGALWEQAGVPREAAVRHRVAVEFVPGGDLAADGVTIPEHPLAMSDTEEIMWRRSPPEKSLFVVDTPSTKVFLGHLAGGNLELDGLRFEVGETETGWAAIALTSMDDLPLTESARMLLVVMSKVENQGMGWDEDRRTVGRNWGHGPTIAEGVAVRATFPRPVMVWALDGAGRRVRQIGEIGTHFSLGPDERTVWYEVGIPQG